MQNFCTAQVTTKHILCKNLVFAQRYVKYAQNMFLR